MSSVAPSRNSFPIEKKGSFSPQQALTLRRLRFIPANGMSRYSGGLTARHAAMKLGVSYRTMLRWCKEGRIAAEKRSVLGSKRKEWWVPEEAVRDLIVKALKSSHPTRWQKRLQSKYVLLAGVPAPKGSKLVEGVILTPSSQESPAHFQLKEKAVEFLRARGFTEKGVKLEYQVAYPEVVWHRARRSPAMIPGTLIIDVVGFKNKRPQVAIEVGSCKRDKLIVLSKYWPEVFHWPYGADEPIRFIPTDKDKRRLRKLEDEAERHKRELQERILAYLRREDPEEAKRFQRRIERLRRKRN